MRVGLWVAQESTRGKGHVVLPPGLECVVGAGPRAAAGPTIGPASILTNSACDKPFVVTWAPLIHAQALGTRVRLTPGRS